ncbi:hypothetical protein JNJ66_03725 [Candidatus Saccharibacteria bacterium]|nr:hypothetical protein [Candidatus Saccharibacteria bacterium]
MIITSRDSVTGVLALGAIIILQAYLHGWWPLLSDVRWTLLAVFSLSVLAVATGYLYDEEPSFRWSLAAAAYLALCSMLAIAGLLSRQPSVVMGIVAATVVFWLASVGVHLFAARQYQRHAPQ